MRENQPEATAREQSGRRLPHSTTTTRTRGRHASAVRSWTAPALWRFCIWNPVRGGIYVERTQPILKPAPEGRHHREDDAPTELGGSHGTALLLQRCCAYGAPVFSSARMGIGLKASIQMVLMTGQFHVRTSSNTSVASILPPQKLLQLSK